MPVPGIVSDASPSPLVEIYDRLAAIVEPRKPCLFGSRLFTYGQLFDRVARLAAYYSRIGLRTDDRVAILTRDDVAIAWTTLSLMRFGLTAVVLNPGMSELELRSVLDAAEPRLVLADADVADRMNGWAPGCGLGVLAFEAQDRQNLHSNRDATGPHPRSLRGLLEEIEPARQLPRFIPDTTVLTIVFTSGTTSRPKGVEISHRAYGAQFRRIVSQFGFGPTTRMLTASSMYHAYARNVGYVTLLSGGTLVRVAAEKPQDIPALLDAISLYQVTNLAATPRILEMILAYGEGRFDCFRSPVFQNIMSCSSRLPVELWKECERQFGVVIADRYASTEAGGILFCGPNPGTRRVGTLGKPVGCEIRILNDDGEPVEPGAAGELVVRSDTVMKGYFRMPAETAAVLRDGWYFTGDLVAHDADGFVRYVGRKRDVIICGGANIHPDDITSVLAGLDGIAEAVAFGIDDPVFGEVPIACIVPSPGARISEEAITEQFLARASPRLLPRHIHVVQALPRTDSGKVRIAELKRIFANRQSAAGA